MFIKTVEILAIILLFQSNFLLPISRCGRLLAMRNLVDLNLVCIAYLMKHVLWSGTTDNSSSIMCSIKTLRRFVPSYCD